MLMMHPFCCVRQHMYQHSHVHFVQPWQTIHASSRSQILSRKISVHVWGRAYLRFLSPCERGCASEYACCWKQLLFYCTCNANSRGARYVLERSSAGHSLIDAHDRWHPRGRWLPVVEGIIAPPFACIPSMPHMCSLRLVLPSTATMRPWSRSGRNATRRIVLWPHPLHALWSHVVELCSLSRNPYKIRARDLN